MMENVSHQSFQPTLHNHQPRNKNMCSTTEKVIYNLRISSFARDVRKEYKAGRLEWHLALGKLKYHLLENKNFGIGGRYGLCDLTRSEGIVHFLCHLESV